MDLLTITIFFRKLKTAEMYVLFRLELFSGDLVTFIILKSDYNILYDRLSTAFDVIISQIT